MARERKRERERHNEGGGGGEADRGGDTISTKTERSPCAETSLAAK